MKRMNFSALLTTIASLVASAVYSQSSEPLIGKWEGVHYYGDTTRLYDGTLLVRSLTIDSMRMILTIEQIGDGKFTGKLHEHSYSDPKGSYFNANVSGSVNNEKIYFTSFVITENTLPRDYRWCQPKATGSMVKKDTSYFLNMAFESTLTCTVGPAIVEKKVPEKKAEEIITAPAPVVPQPSTYTGTTTDKQKAPAVNIIPKQLSSIAEKKTPEKKAEENITAPAPVVPQPSTYTGTTTDKQKAPAVNITPKQLSSIAEKFKTRSQKVNSLIKVLSDSIKINFFDNGVIDGDSISVFINGQLHASHIRLTTTVYSIQLQFEKGKDEIEIAMFAENLGSIPPNTALMQVVDGTKIHQAYLSSDITSNAVIKIRKAN